MTTVSSVEESLQTMPIELSPKESRKKVPDFMKCRWGASKQSFEGNIAPKPPAVAIPGPELAEYFALNKATIHFNISNQMIQLPRS